MIQRLKKAYEDSTDTSRCHPRAFQNDVELETCGKKTHIPNPFKSTDMNEPNAIETATYDAAKSEWDAISIVRETEIERLR